MTGASGRNDRDFLRSLGMLFERDASYSCAIGISTFLEKGGLLGTARWIAGHADSRRTKGYDRRATKLELSEIARVRDER
ncbi:MAG: hypothetical protein WCK51_09585 [Armatimonadota bacterium]